MPRYDKQKPPIQPLYIASIPPNVVLFIVSEQKSSKFCTNNPLLFCRISSFHQQYHQVYSYFHLRSLNKTRSNDAGQVFGFDIMLDHKYKAFLLEASGDINDILTGNV